MIYKKYATELQYCKTDKNQNTLIWRTSFAESKNTKSKFLKYIKIWMNIIMQMNTTTYLYYIQIRQYQYNLIYIYWEKTAVNKKAKLFMKKIKTEK